MTDIYTRVLPAYYPELAEYIAQKMYHEMRDYGIEHVAASRIALNTVNAISAGVGGSQVLVPVRVGELRG